MKLPKGTDGGVITNPPEKNTVLQLMGFQGVIDIDTTLGRGYVLTRKGTLIAACFKDRSGFYYGNDALDRMGSCNSDDLLYYLQGFFMHHNVPPHSDAGSPPILTLRSYTDDEFRQALDICRKDSLTLTNRKKGLVTKLPNPLDEDRLRKMLSLYGIVAISTFYEGFAVQSMGNADFEHVAALAEDLLRAGIKIIREMKIGNLNQLILETGTNKIIIAPCGDLYLCVFARGDAQLGLLRVAIKNLQLELSENG